METKQPKIQFLYTLLRIKDTELDEINKRQETIVDIMAEDKLKIREYENEFATLTNMKNNCIVDLEAIQKQIDLKTESEVQGDIENERKYNN